MPMTVYIFVVVATYVDQLVIRCRSFFVNIYLKVFNCCPVMSILYNNVCCIRHCRLTVSLSYRCHSRYIMVNNIMMFIYRF